MEKIRVLYSFPHKIGASRICTTAWYQAAGVLEAGADMWVYPGAVSKGLPNGTRLQPTLAWGRIRLPYTLIGSMRAFALHDEIVSHRLKRIARGVDIIHVWPLGALRTLKTARALGIPSVLERPNAHTRYAYEVVKNECINLGIQLPKDHEHAYNDKVLRKEEQEYELATKLLCPSDFVAKTFIDEGFAESRIARHQYGYDHEVYFPDPARKQSDGGLSVIYVGGCAPRKGLHYALTAWLQSSACKRGRFTVVGGFVPGYADLLSEYLAHESVQVLGHREDVPALMRESDILVLSSIEEGSALVTSEARGSGCVILVSEASGANCTHLENALVHKVGDVNALKNHFDMLNEDRALLNRLRSASIASTSEITWSAAGRRLMDVYKETISAF